MADNDYILRKDALAFQDEIEPHFCFDEKTRNIFSATKDADLVGYLNAIPAADVRPVVRCKDCKWYMESKVMPPMRFCYRLKDSNGNPVGYNFAESDFCSYAERI